MNRVPKNSVDWHYDDKASWTCPNHQFQSPINIVHSDTKPMNDDGELVLRYRKKSILWLVRATAYKVI